MMPHDDRLISTSRTEQMSNRAPDSGELVPFISMKPYLRQQGYLVPGVLTVVFVVLMFASIGIPVLYNLVLATYIAGAATYFVYRLCDRHKPWWVLFAAGFVTIALLSSPVLALFILVFRGILPGYIPENIDELSFVTRFIRMLFGAGLMEEALKSIPVFGALWLGRRLRSPWRERIGVWDPLDGILLGVASGVGFTLFETLGQYVPNIVNSVPELSRGTGYLLGIELLIPRMLGSIAGHMAYSGYFGYFIGLSVLFPRKRWRTLLVGYFSSATLHALWNSTSNTTIILSLVGGLSFAFLMAAILKAKELLGTASPWVSPPKDNY